MKLGWLVWYDEDSVEPILVDQEPEYCHNKIQIVYCEVKI